MQLCTEKLDEFPQIILLGEFDIRKKNPAIPDDYLENSCETLYIIHYRRYFCPPFAGKKTMYSVFLKKQGDGHVFIVSRLRMQYNNMERTIR